MKNRAFWTIAILVVMITMSGMAFVDDSWAISGGTGAGPGGSAGSGSAGGGGGAGSGSAGGGDGAGSGSSGGGDGAGSGSVGSGSAGGGDGAGTAASVGVPGDARLPGKVEGGVFVASTSPVSFSRPPSASGSYGLTRNQERTWDAFQLCATRGAMIDQLRFDGSFTFEAGGQSDVRTIQDCMTRVGYRFNS